jgi:hypothetical protein
MVLIGEIIFSKSSRPLYILLAYMELVLPCVLQIIWEIHFHCLNTVLLIVYDRGEQTFKMAATSKF